MDFPGGTVVKNPPANAGEEGSVPELGTKPNQKARWGSSTGMVPKSPYVVLSTIVGTGNSEMKDKFSS